MDKQTVCKRIHEIGIVPSARLSSASDAVFAAEAISRSGIPIVEVTMTVPGAVAVIKELAASDSELVVGAGTVLDLDTAKECLDAGAKFLTSPGTDLELMEFAQKRDIAVFPGALTPTEVAKAWKAGADFVKVFPCAQVGGPSYIRALRSPFPAVPLIASGGVNQQTARDFILAGANALGIGRDLIAPDAIAGREGNWIRELSRRYREIVGKARAQLGG